MRKQQKYNSENQKFTMIVALAVALVMIISFIVALSKFADGNDVAVSSEDSSREESSSAATIESSEIEEIVSEPDYEYYDKIALQEIDVNNSEVVNGSLAILKNDSAAFPSPKESDMENVYAVKSDVYGLSGNGLELYKDAIKHIDDFIVAFYNEVPDNGLIIDKAYVEPADANADDGSVDLASGYSVKFSIFGSSYSFSDAEFGYLKEQAYRYGVIQRYPDGKKSHTGFDESSALYRYVGLAHSWYMNYYKISLEEYIDKLRTEKVFEFKSGIENNTAYVIYYVPMDEKATTTSVPVPSDENYNYIISGDGSKGFVVTVQIPVG